MTRSMHHELAALLRRADALRESGQALQAELVYLDALKRWPAAEEALLPLAELALRRGDATRAIGFLETVVSCHPEHQAAILDLGLLHLRVGQVEQARSRFAAATQAMPDFFSAWLLLGHTCEATGDVRGALMAYFRALVEARNRGVWVDEESTLPQLLPMVLRAAEVLRQGRKELLLASYDHVRQAHGDDALARVDRALSGYLREWDATPSDPRQRPKFFFFPGLPTTPFHDPELQPWAPRLREAFPRIRAEALRVLEEEAGRLPDFIGQPEGSREFVSGASEAPSWKAFFFYRHGRRYDDHHQRCPATSAVLESMDLCRIEDQAPEILFSVLAPGSHINPHHGVSNVRLVMHLPLIVPPDCALQLLDHGTHSWQEGRLVMFDDTYLHEAWNRSDQTRVVLLMDCWNPHLTAPERLALKNLLETISALQRADRMQPVWRDS